MIAQPGYKPVPDVDYDVVTRIQAEVVRGLPPAQPDTAGEAEVRRRLTEQLAELQAAGYGADVSAEHP